MIVGRNFLINLLEMTKTYENTRKIACVQIDIAQSVASCLIDQPYFKKKKKKKVERLSSDRQNFNTKQVINIMLEKNICNPDVFFI